MAKVTANIVGVLLLAFSMVLPSRSSEVNPPDKHLVADRAIQTHSTAQISEEFYRSTYKVRGIYKRGEYVFTGYGSAFGVDLEDFGFKGKRYLLTAAHVVLENGEVCRTIEVEIRKSKYKSKMWARAKVIAYDREVDIALIKLEINVPYRAKIAKKDRLRRGSPLIAVGCPSAAGVTATLGHLSSKETEAKNRKGFWWQASMPIYYGNSGGPVWDPKRTEIVGIVVAGIGRKGLAPNVSFFVSHKYMIRFLKSGVVKKAVKRGGMEPPKRKFIPIPPIPKPGKGTPKSKSPGIGKYLVPLP